MQGTNNMAQDRFEKPNITAEALPHTGKLEGDLQELPLTEGTPSIQEFNDLDTGELGQVLPAPETSGALTLEDNERDDFQRKLAAQREYNEQRASKATESQSHTGRNIGIAATSLVLAAGATAGVVIANSQPQATSPNTQPSATGAPVPGETQAPAATKTPESPLASPTNLGPLETAKPTPSKVETAPGALNEFGITAAEYEKVKDSVTIDANVNKTPAEVAKAFTTVLDNYYAGGHSMETRNAHYTDTTPKGQVGWNAWSNELYTKALTESLFIPGYSDRSDSAIPNLEENKSIVNRLWVNAAKANEKEYKSTTAFTIEKVSDTTENAFTVVGTLSQVDNSAEIPSAASDSGRINGTLVSKNVEVSFVKHGDQWQVFSLANIG